MKLPSFVCDVHLAKLARHLRMVGLDTLLGSEYDPEWNDDQLLAMSFAEQRVLLTRDHELCERSAAGLRHYVSATAPDLQLKEVLTAFELWDYVDSHRGFLTRCLECNAMILPVKHHQIADRVPGDIRLKHDDFFLCPRCERVYWKGSHYDRMKAWVSRLRIST